MNICENCGTANGELETECRICGHALAGLPLAGVHLQEQVRGELLVERLRNGAVEGG